AKTLADDPMVMDAAMSSSDFIYFSGITLAILAPEKRTALLTALRKARAAGKTIAFDPNLRPSLWTSENEMTQAIMEGAAVSDIALPSFEDEAVWFKDANPQATADRYLAAGVVTVVVKNGADPVVYAEGGASGEVAVTPLTQLVDTTAAGDSFNAGFFARHAVGDSIADGIAYACALSRAVVQERGALVAIDPASLT
ncbi:MAG: PfkB family carbohydrate kinase, partial [Pseudomonadota bacterium]